MILKCYLEDSNDMSEPKTEERTQFASNLSRGEAMEIQTGAMHNDPNKISLRKSQLNESVSRSVRSGMSRAAGSSANDLSSSQTISSLEWFGSVIAVALAPIFGSCKESLLAHYFNM